MGAGKSKLEGVTMKILFDGDSRAFDANHPICGTIQIDSNQEIAAYGIQLKLELIDMSKEVDYGSKGERIRHKMKRRAWDLNQMIYLENSICPVGTSSIPFNFQIPDSVNLPQSFYFAERFRELRCKLRYFFKAQLVPVSTDLLNNRSGKSQVRDRQRVHYSPVRPVVCDPQFNILLPFQKKVGLISSKHVNLQVSMSKNFFMAGEMAYLAVNIDNSSCKDPCSLIISHKARVRVYQNWRKLEVKRTHRKENFALCGPGESKQLILQFQIGTKRHNAPGPGFFGKHAGDYHYVDTLAPESVHSNTFNCANYLELSLSHSNTTFSSYSKKKFYFQLIQHSLVPGIVESPPPIFLDTNGNPIGMEAPVVGAPEGEIITGEAMDLGEEIGSRIISKKGEEQDFEEQADGAIAKQT